jgi:hypothetical protein
LRRNKAVSRKRRVEIAVQSEMICTVSGFDEGAVSYQHDVIRILLLVATAGVL